MQLSVSLHINQLLDASGSEFGSALVFLNLMATRG
jgi:hypothetical protein